MREQVKVFNDLRFDAVSCIGISFWCVFGFGFGWG